jgi:cob(I)alamin adenosyltransferase
MQKKTAGMIQIYTGNGRGKTSAAIGLTVRAAGHGLKTFFVTFMKDHPYGEFIFLRRFAEFITIEQYGNDEFVFKKTPPSDEDIRLAKTALERAYQEMLGGRYDMIVLDEVCVCIYFGLLETGDLIPLFENKPEDVELVLTGRYCPPEWMERANLVTEMKEIKHYYQKGVVSREGFDC